MNGAWLIEIDCNPEEHPAKRWGAEIRDPNGEVHQTIEAPTARELCDELAVELDSVPVDRSNRSRNVHTDDLRGDADR